MIRFSFTFILEIIDNILKKTGKILKSKIAGPGQETEEVLQMIPAKYGAQSELKVDISAKNLRHDFDLKSK